MVDVLICLSVFLSHPGYARKILWIIGKNERFSNFGFMSWLHDDCFLDTTKGSHEKSLDDLKCHLERAFQQRNRKCVILFPEGGFFSKKKHQSILYAKKNELPILRHIAYPRIGALQVILDTLSNGIVSNEMKKKILHSLAENKREVHINIYHFNKMGVRLHWALAKL